MSDILSLIREHVHLERQGKNYVGLCPFHQEKTSSFTVDPSADSFYCLGCGASGGTDDFLRRMAAAKAVLAVKLHVAPGFTGRVLLYVENGRVKAENRLLPAEHCTTVEGFVELARLAGWQVMPAQGVCNA